MTVLDIVLAALLLFGLIKGLMKGLFVEVASLIALIAGIYGAIHFSAFAFDFLEPKIFLSAIERNSPSLTPTPSIFVVFDALVT